jgi:Na+/alanine symporter
VEPAKDFLPSLNQRMAAIAESPTKRTLGFTRGTVVVVVVVVNSMVVSAATVVVVLVVVVDSLESEESACEMDELKLTTNAAESRPAMNRVVVFFITLTAHTAGHSPQPIHCQTLLSCARSPQKVLAIQPEPHR